MMGPVGLKKATEIAVLSANYLVTRLGNHYSVLYRGRNGRVAHECILDTRMLKDRAGISVEDIAKRLIDYGFHAPTMSFPVPGTLMVEPTESEPKSEVDRLCEALIKIADEAVRVEKGEWPRNDNPLVNAPHTAAETLAAEWKHPYSRMEAAYPANEGSLVKYWPPVSRLNNVAGDRNLICSCPPLSAYGDAAE
jgi:glycine dehydrogenase